MTAVQLVLLVVAGTDLAVGVMLIRWAPRASRPEPARITGVLLLACGAGLLALLGARHQPAPAPPSGPAPVPPAVTAGPIDGNDLPGAASV